MAVLLLADHDGKNVSQPTRSAVAACAKLGDVHVLVLGEGAAAAAPAAPRAASQNLRRAKNNLTY